MEIFQFSKIFWKYFAVIYLPSNAKRSHKLLSASLNAIHIGGLLITVYASSVKFYYEQNGLPIGQMMMIFMQLFINFGVALNYAFYCSRKSRLAELIDQFQRTINKRYNSNTAKIYENAERNAKFFSKWPFIAYIIIFNAMLIIVTAIHLIVSLVQGEMDVNKWPNLIQIR